MKSKYIYIIMCMVLALTMLPACETNVELCNEPEHPHAVGVLYSFLWDEEDPTHVPDSMYVIANRIIGQWKSSMVIGSQSTPGWGYYYYTDMVDMTKKSSNDAAPNTEDDTTGSEEEGEEMPEQPTVPLYVDKGVPGVDYPTAEFLIKKGEYKFVAFSMDTTELIYDNVVDFIISPPSEGKVLQDIYVSYKTYPKDNNGGKLRQIINDWTDYNPYAQYIQPDMQPVYFDTIAVRKIDNGSSRYITFLPKRLTQNIDIYFNVQKRIKETPFVIDSIRAEISGIPHSINFSNGYIDIEHTDKMMFKTDLVNNFDAAAKPPYNNTVIVDSKSRSQLGCHANINVTSLVRNQSSSVYTGPGIMQVMIYAHADNPNPKSADDKVLYKKMQGKINLYHTLDKTKLYEITDDGKHARRSSAHAYVVVKAADIIVDGEKIVSAADDNGGLDKWEPCDEIRIDI